MSRMTILAAILAVGLSAAARAAENYECSYADASRLGTLHLDGAQSYLARSPSDVSRCSLAPGDSNPLLLACAKETKKGKDVIVEKDSFVLILFDRAAKTFQISLYLPSSNHFVAKLDGACKKQ